MSKRQARQPIYLRTARLVDPATGHQVSALVPAGAADVEMIRERGVTIGQMLRADLTKPRNPEFHRLAHALGDLVRKNIEGFEECTAHGAIKRLQEVSGIGCDITRTEIPSVGVLVSKQPRSIAFDSMDQGEFFELVRSLCRFIAERYWPQCTAEEVEQMVELMPLEGA